MSTVQTTTVHTAVKQPAAALTKPAGPTAAHAEAVQEPARITGFIPGRPVLVQRKCAHCEEEEKQQKSAVQYKLVTGSVNDPQEAEADRTANEVMQAPATTQVQRKCAHCAEEEKKNPPVAVQRKLTIGAIGDPMEEEADDMADEVMRMPDTTFVQSKCAHCEEEEKVQKKPLAAHVKGNRSVREGEVPHNHIAGRIEAARGGGAQLAAPVRHFMESRFGADFSRVRVHTGSDAAQLSKALHAQAFATGNDIYFNTGKYAPETFAGRHLLAHELTHTLQQNGIQARAIQRDGENCVTGLPEGKGEVVNEPAVPEITYVMWGTFKKGQSNRDFLEQTIKAWLRWRFGTVDSEVGQKMFAFASSKIWTGKREGDDCQHAVPVTRDVMTELQKISGEADNEKKEKDAVKQTVTESEKQDEQPAAPVKADWSVLSDADLAKRLLLLLEHYAHKSITPAMQDIAAKGMDDKQVDELLGKDVLAITVAKFFTQAYVEYTAAGGKSKEDFYKLSEMIIEQFTRGNPTAAHNLLKIGTGVRGMQTPDGRDEGDILGIADRNSGMLLYDSTGTPLPGIAGVGMRDKGYTAARNESRWGINIAAIKDEGLRSLLNALRQSFGDQARMTSEAAKIYYDNSELVNAKVRAGLPDEIIQNFENMLPMFVGFIAGHAVSTFLMRFPNPPVVAVGVALKALLVAAGYVMDIEFAAGALEHLMEAAYHITRIEKDDKGQLTKLSDDHLESAAIPIRKMVADIALMAGMHGLGKLLGRMKSGESKGRIECTECKLTEGGETEKGKEEGGTNKKDDAAAPQKKYKYSDIPELRKRPMAAIKGLIKFGDTDLSKIAMDYRKANKISPGRNVAVIEYLDSDGTLKTEARASKRMEGHSERKLGDFMEFSDLSPERMIRLFTEREPCSGGGGYCARFMNNIYTNTILTWAIDATNSDAMKILKQYSE